MHGFGVSDSNFSFLSFVNIAMKHYVFSFLIEHEKRIDRIRVHPCDPCNPCSMSFAPVYTFSESRHIYTSGHEIWDTTEIYASMAEI